MERGRRQSEKQAESLRDGILKIVTKNGANYYVLFRDSKIAEKQPLSLSTGTQRLMKDDLSPGCLPMDWIKNDSLVGTKWTLGIRKWKITSKLPAEPLPRVIAFGDAPKLPASVDGAIIPEEASVRLKIDAKNKEPHIIKVFLSFEKERVIKRRADTRRLRQLEHQESKTNVEDDEMKKLQKMLVNIHDIMDMEHRLLPPSQVELSVIIGLRIDDSTVLNIAKFGDFAR